MVQDSPSRKLDQYIVRFPDGMRDRLKDEALKNKRSLNAEIVARLEASFEHSDGVVLELKEDDLRKVIIGIMADGASREEVREAFRIMGKVAKEELR